MKILPSAWNDGHPNDTFITSVERQPKNRHRYNIFIDGVYAFSVHEEVLIKHRLLKGERIDADTIRSVLEEEEQQQAYLHAIQYIGRKPRAEKEVTVCLRRKGFAPQLIERVVRKLKEQKYIDDAQFAKLWTDHRIYSHKKGRKWVQQELLLKGVSKERVQDALRQIDEDEEFRCAYELAAKRWTRQDAAQPERSRKVAAFLLRRGYPHSMVSRIIRQLRAETNDTSEWTDDVE